jgi:hypothetical protein
MRFIEFSFAASLARSRPKTIGKVGTASLLQCYGDGRFWLLR